MICVTQILTLTTEISTSVDLERKLDTMLIYIPTFISSNHKLLSNLKLSSIHNPWRESTIRKPREQIIGIGVDRSADRRGQIGARTWISMVLLASSWLPERGNRDWRHGAPAYTACPSTG
uniref:Uncharacterized protein n=1 Tax=Arundo donax TaxID=35708 RepID=A0A0A9GSV7_ARUDO